MKAHFCRHKRFAFQPRIHPPPAASPSEATTDGVVSPPEVLATTAKLNSTSVPLLSAMSEFLLEHRGFLYRRQFQSMRGHAVRNNMSRKGGLLHAVFPYLSKNKNPRDGKVEAGTRQRAASSEQAKRLAQRAKGRTLCAMRFARGAEDPGAAAGHRGDYASSETRPYLMAKRTRPTASWT